MTSEREAMVAVIAVLAFLFIICLALLGGGLACLFTYVRRDSRGDNPGAGLSVASGVLVGIGGMGAYFMLFMVIGFAIGMTENAPTSVVTDDIYIDEFGEEYEYFTVGDARYDVLELVPSYDMCYSLGEEKFMEYYSEDEYYWYYGVENDGGFDLVFDGYRSMFAPADQHEAIYERYTDAYGESWYAYSEATNNIDVKLSDEASAALTSIAGTADSLELKLIEGDELYYINAFLPSDDGIFYLTELTLLRLDGKLYLFMGYGVGEGQYYAAEVPSLLANRLSELK